MAERLSRQVWRQAHVELLVSRGTPAPKASGAVTIEVDDTLMALQELGHHMRRLSGASVVAITGSAGKTSTKEATAEFLATRHTVYRSVGNLNNHIGLPLTLLELRSRPDVAVVELGMNHAGEISRLVELAEPDVRVWTNVGDAHVGHFASVDAIADAKAEVLERATDTTRAVVNGDDARVMARVKGFVGHVTTFGLGRHTTIRATDVRDRGARGTTARLVTPAGEADVSVPHPRARCVDERAGGNRRRAGLRRAAPSQSSSRRRRCRRRRGAEK